MKTTLRSVLKAQNPMLYDALEHSTDIAHKQWLANIPSKLDSYNSFPHLLGVENHLDDLLYGDEAPEHIIALNTTEIYILLCSVLLHDIGRTRPDAKKDHGRVSMEIIQKSWAELGIVSKQLAIIIGHICDFHTYAGEPEKRNLKEVYSIDRYQSIRGRKLATLLLLADKLDNAFSRVVPDYLLEDEDAQKVVGAFRNKTQAIRVDCRAKIVCTVIISDNFHPKDYNDRDKFDGDLRKLLMRVHWDRNTLPDEQSSLYTITKDVYENNNTLAIKEIQKELYAMHIPLSKWMIECDNRLFIVEKDSKGKYLTKEVVEPILHEEYVRRVMKGIIRLSGSSFGKPFHTYEELLRYVREDMSNMYKVVYAVKRLSAVLWEEKDEQEEPETGVEIYCDDIGWKIIRLSAKEVEQGGWLDDEQVKRLIDTLFDDKLKKFFC